MFEAKSVVLYINAQYTVTNMLVDIVDFFGVYSFILRLGHPRPTVTLNAVSPFSCLLGDATPFVALG